MPCSFFLIVRCWLTHTELLKFWHYSGYGSVCHSSLRNIFLSASNNIDTVCIRAQLHLTLCDPMDYSPQGTHTYMYTHINESLRFFLRYPVQFPVLCNKSLLVTYFIYSSVCILILIYLIYLSFITYKIMCWVAVF